MNKIKTIALLSVATLGLATQPVFALENTTNTSTEQTQTAKKTIYHINLVDTNKFMTEGFSLTPVTGNPTATIETTADLTYEQVKELVEKEFDNQYIVRDKVEVLDEAVQAGMTEDKIPLLLTSLLGGARIDTDGNTVIEQSFFVIPNPDYKESNKYSISVHLLDAQTILTNQTISEVKTVTFESETVDEKEILDNTKKNLPQGYVIVTDHNIIIEKIKDLNISEDKKQQLLKELEDKYGNQVNGTTVTTGFWVIKENVSLDNLGKPTPPTTSTTQSSSTTTPSDTKTQTSTSTSASSNVTQPTTTTQTLPKTGDVASVALSSVGYGILGVLSFLGHKRKN